MSIIVNLFARWRHQCYRYQLWPRFETESVLTCDLIILTFNPLTSKWGHGSPVSWDSFLPIFSLLRPSILNLVSGTGQTDGQTTDINALCPTLWGRVA